jgi:L-ribulose-5-phosphate 3-epimerase UlaE
VSVHLKDFTVLKHRAGYQITGAPLGKGWLDVSATLALLTRSPRRPRLLLELWVEPGPDKDETARKEQAWLVASLDYARDLLLGDGRSGIPIRPSGRS